MNLLTELVWLSVKVIVSFAVILLLLAATALAFAASFTYLPIWAWFIATPFIMGLFVVLAAVALAMLDMVP